MIILPLLANGRYSDYFSSCNYINCCKSFVLDLFGPIFISVNAKQHEGLYVKSLVNFVNNCLIVFSTFRSINSK